MADLMIGKTTDGKKLPVQVDSTGKLQIGGVSLDNLNVNTDQIEAKQDTTNAILTTTAADVAAIKSPLSGVTQTSASGKVGLDVNVIAGGGGGASAAYNATLPTYTSGASTTLQTDQNGRLITTGPELQTISTEAQAIDAKLPSLSSGRVPVEANNAASQVYNYTYTGSVATNTVMLGPVEALQFREVAVHGTSLGSGMNWRLEISNDSTTWVAIQPQRTDGTILVGNVSSNGGYIYILNNFRFFRIVCQNPQTSGTTTLVAYASQQATPKLYQQVTISGLPLVTSIPTQNPSYGFGLYHSLVSSASTNATNLKTTQATIGTCVLTNTSASWRYVKIFNLAVAPTMGTSTPVIQFPVPPNSSLDVSMSFAGLRLSTGLSYAITGGSALLDTTAVGAGDVLVNLSYV